MSAPGYASTPGSTATLVFRLPRSAYLPVLLLGAGVTVLVQSWWWTPVYLVPLLAAMFVARRSTVVNADTVIVRALFGTRRIAWRSIRGLAVDSRGTVRAALSDATLVALPYVRAHHLPELAEVSGGRLPAVPTPTPAQPAPPSGASGVASDDVALQ